MFWYVGNWYSDAWLCTKLQNLVHISLIAIENDTLLFPTFVWWRHANKLSLSISAHVVIFEWLCCIFLTNLMQISTSNLNTLGLIIYRNSIWWPPPSWICTFGEFRTFCTMMDFYLSSVPNLVQISVIVSEIDAILSRRSIDDVTRINFRFRFLRLRSLCCTGGITFCRVLAASVPSSQINNFHCKDDGRCDRRHFFLLFLSFVCLFVSYLHPSLSSCLPLSFPPSFPPSFLRSFVRSFLPSFFLSIYLCVCLCVCLSVCVSVCLSVCLSVYLSIYLSIFFSIMGRHTLPSYASAEACLTGWPNAQPRDGTTVVYSATSSG